MTERVILLGTGTPIPDPKHSGPSVAVVVEDAVYIVDFGPGLVRRAVEAGIKPPQLTRGFLTHLHSDHTVGYPDLILTPAVVGRKEALEVYGPIGLKSMTDNILAAYQSDIHMRVNGLEHANSESYYVNVHEIREDETKPIYTDEFISVEAFPVIHGDWPSFGFKFKTPERTIVISGDTAPSEVLVDRSMNCDILIHEVYSTAYFEEQTPDWKRYFTAMHTSSYELTKIASQVKPKLLVLYHQLDTDQLLSEIREYYEGEVVYGNDLDTF